MPTIPTMKHAYINGTLTCSQVLMSITPLSLSTDTTPLHYMNHLYSYCFLQFSFLPKNDFYCFICFLFQNCCHLPPKQHCYYYIPYNRQYKVTGCQKQSQCTSWKMAGNKSFSSFLKSLNPRYVVSNCVHTLLYGQVTGPTSYIMKSLQSLIM